MQQWLKNERGVTLIEVIVAFALLTMILLLISNVHLSGQRQFTDQTNQIDGQANVRLAFKWMTSDVRKQGNVHDVNEVQSSLKIGTITYTFSKADKTIRRDDAVIAENIESFTPEYDEAQEKLTLTIKSAETPHQKDLSKEFKTVIYIRK
ncbi:PilW family protein [Domibacillus aminovorans]|uniref:Prepilin-type N-terminal cleavage/methylation domain-containing protein n=1 Tax=Domibacillus aminovorans TaxID=29332 RepID=A0A177LBB8_9BACI|nr:prepilin-type N-terminal cleavage/methylation domain-containing protein [Domibacillus aminovorans]OAH62706.1 hypothetical protein AWH49_08550 [Domibacillus aminovorans]